MGASEHRSSLYVLGKPGTGKSTFLVNCICQNLQRGFATFFLDPHEEAIREVFKRSRAIRNRDVIHEIAFFDPTNQAYSFGINPLRCADVRSLALRRNAIERTLDVF